MLKALRDWLVVLTLFAWAVQLQIQVIHLQLQTTRLRQQLEHQLRLQLRVVGLIEHVNQREHRLADWLKNVHDEHEPVDDGGNKQ